MSTGSLNIPPPTAVNGNSGGPQQNGAGGMGRFEGPRSPPGRQSKWNGQMIGWWIHLLIAVDTSHVPCKFFRQGACQAGQACPFSHDLTNTSDNICKYFAKVSTLSLASGMNASLTIPGKLQIRTKMRKHTRSPRWTAGKLQTNAGTDGRSPSEYWRTIEYRIISLPE